MNSKILGSMLLASSSLLAGCLSGGDDSASNSASTNESGGAITPAETTGRTFLIKPGPNATEDMARAMIQLKPKDVLKFDCGFFDLKTGIQITNTENVTIQGCGKDETFLSFRDSNTQEGFLATNSKMVTIKDLTIGDSPGDAFKLKGVNFGNLLRVRAIWSSGRKLPTEIPITAANYKQKLNVACTQPPTHNPNNKLNPPDAVTKSPDYEVSSESGRYGIYPVQSRNILVEETESIGASDAGIYVGQTNIAKIRKSRAVYNVFGFEIENVQDGEYSENLAECNTGGFLVYDLDGLTQYGSRSRVVKNVSRKNNTYNFAIPGSIVANVPRGSGFITLAYDKIDIHDNVFEDNSTAGIILTSYVLLGENGDRRMDVYTEAVNIYNNTFKNNGTDLPEPNFDDIVASGGDRVTSAFPMLVGLKSAAGGGGYNGAHIVWDGYEDKLDTACAYPKDNAGKEIPKDADGKPIQGNDYPNPSCRYNAYKFKSDGARKVPVWWFSCINPNNNKFEGSVKPFANFHGTRGLEAVLNLSPSDPAKALTPEFVQAAASGVPEFPADFDMSKHDCLKRFGAELQPLPDFQFETYVPTPTTDSGANSEQVRKLCEAPLKAGVVNEDAYSVNCPDLKQYNLFQDAQDPSSLPNGRSMPYVLNAKLFTDYAIKHRVLFLPSKNRDVNGPKGNAEPKAIFLADEGNAELVNQTIKFPVGTIIAKTFSFVDQPNKKETPYETRLLIKRQQSDGRVFWDSLEYIWEDNGDGTRSALLNQAGKSGYAEWDYVDVDSKITHKGNTANYLYPNATQCALCHSNTNKETGSAPIGPKPRNMNRAYVNESPLVTGQSRHPVSGKNQLKFMCENGLMEGCPSQFTLDAKQVATNVPHIPKFSVAGDSGHPANSKKDLEARARAYLESNCAHCHNNKGQASNTGFYLDVFRPVDGTMGVCKKPTASGSEGRGNRLYDIRPGNGLDSIVSYRVGPEATVLAAMMPPLGRSTVQTEAYDLLNKWITEVVDSSYANADACEAQSSGGGSTPIPLGGFGVAKTASKKK